MTYNQLVSEIQTLLESHRMLNTVRFASPTEWLNWDSVPVFPLGAFAINSGGFNIGREQTYQLQLWFLDKSGVEGEFETEVTSDMHGVAADIISKLRNGANEYTIDDNIGWNAVTEKFEDYLSGVELTFNLSVRSNFDACDMPIAENILTENGYNLITENGNNLIL